MSSILSSYLGILFRARSPFTLRVLYNCTSIYNFFHDYVYCFIIEVTMFSPLIRGRDDYCLGEIIGWWDGLGGASSCPLPWSILFAVPSAWLGVPMNRIGHVCATEADWGGRADCCHCSHFLNQQSGCLFWVEWNWGG